MQNSNSIRLLIIEQNQNEAEALVTLFRNAGHAARAHRLTSIEDLEECLSSQSWDLLISLPETESISAEQALTLLQARDRDIPLLVLIDENDERQATDWLRLGAQDALPIDDEERLLLVAQRELRNLYERRQRRRIEAALKETERRCELLLDSSKDAIAYIHDGMHVYTNQAYLDLFQYEEADELAGMTLIDLISSQDQAEFKQFFKNYQRGAQDQNEFAFTGITDQSAQFQASMQLTPASFEGEPCIQIVIRVQEQNAELAEKLKEISSQDQLTGLYNRQFMVDRLQQRIQQAAEGESSGTLIWLALDHYSELEERHGIARTETLLPQIVELLRPRLPEEALFGRYSSENFLLLVNEDRADVLKKLCSVLLHDIAEFMGDIEGSTVQTTASIGLAYISDASGAATELLERAHQALNLQQQGGGNGFHFYDPKDELAARAEEGDMVALIQHALSSNGFKLLFQPIISLKDEAEEHYEVLLRLLSPNGEEVSPAEFLSAAAKAGLCEKIDRWVILQAIKMLATHRAKGHFARLFVHLSETTLVDPTLAPWISVALKAAQLPADALIFQLTEDNAERYLKQAKTLTEELEKLGCRIALNHFGRSDSCFNLLKYIRCHYIKVDGSFTKELDSSSEAQEQLAALIGEIGEHEKLSIMPFVENAKVLSVLWRTGIDYIQGAYVQAPTQQMDYDFANE